MQYKTNLNACGTHTKQRPNSTWRGQQERQQQRANGAWKYRLKINQAKKKRHIRHSSHLLLTPSQHVAQCSCYPMYLCSYTSAVNSSRRTWTQRAVAQDRAGYSLRRHGRCNGVPSHQRPPGCVWPKLSRRLQRWVYRPRVQSLSCWSGR